MDVEPLVLVPVLAEAVPTPGKKDKNDMWGERRTQGLDAGRDLLGSRNGARRATRWAAQPA
jgi:hypothetical protein